MRPLWTAIAVATLAGCHSTAPVPARPDAEAEEAAALASFEGLGVTLLPSRFSVERGGGAMVESLAARDAKLDDVLLTLFKDSEINVLIDPDLDNRATFDIKAATLEEAFQVLLDSYDLSYRWDGSFLRISGTEHRTFSVDYPTSERAQSPALGEGGGESSAAAAGGVGSEQGIWTMLADDLDKLAEGDATARVVLNEKIGSVVCEGRPSTVRRIGSYLRNAQRRATRQVAIEARVLEVQLKKEFKAGVNYTLLPGLFNSSNTGTATGGGIVSQSAAAGVGAFQAGLLKAGHFSVFVDALETQGQVRVLSSPRVSALNNTPAVIRVVEQVPVIEREIIDTDSASRTQFSVRFEDAGVSVAVTPQIGEDGVITAVIEPSIVEVSGFVNTPDNLIAEPILNTRNVTTTLRVRNGQPIVLGGLRSQRRNETLEKVPLLGDIPGLGMLFRSTKQERVDTELLIVLFPRILDERWEKEDLWRGTDRLLRLREPFRASSMEMEEGEHTWREHHLDGEAGPGGNRIPKRSRAERGNLAKAPTVLTRKGLGRFAFRRAIDGLQKESVQDGLVHLEEALALDPSLSEAWHVRGLLYARRGRTQSARTALRKAVELMPGDAFAHNNLGLLELRTGNAIAAEAHLRKALAARDLPEVRNNLGVALLRQGDIAAAKKEFLLVSEQRPELAEAHLNLGVILEREGADADAATSYRAFLAAGGDASDPRLGWIARRLQR